MEPNQTDPNNQQGGQQANEQANVSPTPPTQNQPPQTPPQSANVNSQTINKDSGSGSKTPLWIAVGVVVVLLGVVGYLWYANQSGDSNGNQSAATETEADDAAQIPDDWKTYRNEEYGFSINIPNTWRKCTDINEKREKVDRYEGNFELAECFEISEKRVPYANTVDFLAIGYSTGVRFSEFGSFEDIRDYYLGRKADMENNPDKYPGIVGHLWIKKMTLGGMEAIENCAGDAAVLGCSIYTPFNFSNERVFSIVYDIPSLAESSEEIDQILSTFKFTR